LSVSSLLLLQSTRGFLKRRGKAGVHERNGSRKRAGSLAGTAEERKASLFCLQKSIEMMLLDEMKPPFLPKKRGIDSKMIAKEVYLSS
jgi:hypothetical protein